MRRLTWLAFWLTVGCGSSSTTPHNAEMSPAEGGSESPTEGVEAAHEESPCQGALRQAQAAHEEAARSIEAAGPAETLEELGRAACQLYCTRATVCAIDEACNEMDPAEIADLHLQETAPENTRRCLDECATWRLSKDQIRVLGTCSQEDSDCATWQACTNTAEGEGE